MKAVIFDVDGTMLDNNQYHKQAWQQFLKQQGREITDEEFNEKISGRTNMDAVQHIYGKRMSEEEAAKYYLEKEEIYRKLYRPHIKEIAGLKVFLNDLKQQDIAMAIATSGIQVNIDFMFEHLPVKEYFTEIIMAKDINKGKPDPEIFTTTAKALSVAAKDCVVFEDSLAGVKAAKAAGMKVVALTTTHSKDELKQADWVVDDYKQINYNTLTGL